nr:MAG TPA: hypothetical protein [Caudoviricetes sp.]
MLLSTVFRSLKITQRSRKEVILPSPFLEG